MRLCLLFFLLSISLYLVSCTKEDPGIAKRLSGTWFFTDRHIMTYSPDGSLVPMSSFRGSGINFENIFGAGYEPVFVSSMTVSDNSTRLTFNSQGQYTFTSLAMPYEKGYYRLAQDSFLIIQPDSAIFLKFNYPTGPMTNAGTITSPDSIPAYDFYKNYRFVSDTIFCTYQDSSHKLTLITSWISKTAAPVLPFGDTVFFNTCISNFRR